jgi:dephospho-CoA kinase
MIRRDRDGLLAPPGSVYLIGLTGNIATGKSTVGAMLSELGATVIDADRVTHQVLRHDRSAVAQIAAHFSDVVDDAGHVNRKRLAGIVFDDPIALAQLEAIVHPAVATRINQRISAATTPVVVIEAIKLIEAGWHRPCQALWVTICRPEQQMERLIKGRSLSYQEAKIRITAQPPQVAKVCLANVVIDTSGEKIKTLNQVRAAWQSIHTRRSYG